MVAVISTGHSVRRILLYNENKVSEGCARCIGEGNYPMEAGSMNFNMKLNRLARQNALNANVKRNSVHISLNFHPSEHYPVEKLMAIARTYMEKIGFGQQPYLVYEHHDAGHPHIHLVSVKVRADGSRIDMQNIGRGESEKARKAIEQEFGLVRAQDSKEALRPVPRPVTAGRAEYGKTESKKAIAGVLRFVVFSYAYTSLAQLNAVLGLYNIRADRGSENSRIFQSGGLVYRILDRSGRPVGVPVKASDVAGKPTLAFLEKRFAVHTAAQLSEKKRIRNAVDLVFIKGCPSPAGLVVQLKKQGIDVVLRKGDQQILYGITYVDHNSRCVFNGSELGKKYSAKGILERCGETANPAQQTVFHTACQNTPDPDARGNTAAVFGPGSAGVWEMLSTPLWQPDYLPRELKGKRRKKRGKGKGGNQ